MRKLTAAQIDEHSINRVYSVGSFLLPFGLPRRLTSAIHLGGRPRRFPPSIGQSLQDEDGLSELIPFCPWVHQHFMDIHLPSVPDSFRSIFVVKHRWSGAPDLHALPAGKGVGEPPLLSWLCDAIGGSVG
jgi:hypothetical protein